MAGRLVRGLFAAGLVNGLLLWVPGAVSAAEPTAVALGAAEAEDGDLLLEARVTDADGRPVGGVQVRFGARVDFFGERTVPLGTASTDVVGRASVVYRPTANGPQQIVARVSAANGSIASAPLALLVSGASPAVPPGPEVLPIVRRWAIPVAAVVAIGVWLVLGFVLLSTVIGIARAGRSAERVAPPPPQVAVAATDKFLKEG